MGKGLSIRGYARHRGCSETAVRKALATGRIAKEPDGTIDPEKADAAWAANTSRSPSGRKVESASPSEASKAKGNGKVTELTRARLDKLEVDVEHTRVKVDRLKGQLLDRNRVVQEVFAYFRMERDAWLAWPARVSARLASRLGLEHQVVHTALEELVHEHLSELSTSEPPTFA